MVGNLVPRRRYDATLRTERALETRQRILDAAKQLFTARGVERVTITEIALAAGVSAPTLYAVRTALEFEDAVVELLKNARRPAVVH